MKLHLRNSNFLLLAPRANASTAIFLISRLNSDRWSKCMHLSWARRHFYDTVSIFAIVSRVKIVNVRSFVLYLRWCVEGSAATHHHCTFAAFETSLRSSYNVESLAISAQFELSKREFPRFVRFSPPSIRVHPISVVSLAASFVTWNLLRGKAPVMHNTWEFGNTCNWIQNNIYPSSVWLLPL